MPIYPLCGAAVIFHYQLSWTSVEWQLWDLPWAPEDFPPRRACVGVCLSLRCLGCLARSSFYKEQGKQHKIYGEGLRRKIHFEEGKVESLPLTMVSWDAAADTSAAFRVFWWNKKGRRIGGGGSNLGSGHRVSPTYTACCRLRLFSEVLPDKGWHFSPREAPATWPWLRLQDKRRRHESIIITCHLHVQVHSL